MDTQENKIKDTTVYKIWRKGRFLTVNFWAEASKFSIDIGEFDTNTNKLTSSTKCYANALQFHTYLQAELTGDLERIYPDYDRLGFSTFGGSGDTARVFKAHWWSTGGTADKTSRVFKCGHFKAKPGSRTGAFVPENMNNPLSLSSVKVSMTELAEMAHAVAQCVAQNHNSVMKDKDTDDG